MPEPHAQLLSKKYRTIFRPKLRLKHCFRSSSHKNRQNE